MKTVMVPSEPTEGMAFAYKQSDDEVKQLVYYSERFGIFTFIDDRWYPIASGDHSLSGLTFVDVEKSNYKTVRDLYLKAKSNNKSLTYKDIEVYGVEYVVTEERK